MKAFCLIVIVSISVFARQELPPKLYDHPYFQKAKKHPLYDTLFEKTVWKRKVSHLVLEEKSGHIYLTLLMISPYSHNYKSFNYALHYEFKNYIDAYKKYRWLDDFLDRYGVLRIKILGSKIKSEEILFEGYDKKVINR